MYGNNILILIVFVSCACVIIVRSEVLRCFHYTWLGPKFTNKSIYLNATCKHSTKLAKGVPCVQPLVVSYDGTWPNVTYIWAHYSKNASCILADNDVCATYIYYFNGLVENSTAMCTRAVDESGNAITNGCYTHRNGSYTTTACFCRSVPGGIPCNDTHLHFLSTTTTIFTTVIMIYIQFYII